jgi:hypothetical protein
LSVDTFTISSGYPEHLLDEPGIIRNMFQEIDNCNPVKAVSLERHALSIQPVHLNLHQLLNGPHGLIVEVGAFPAPASLAEQVADHTVIRTDVQAVQAFGRP